jgi:tetratricopeptide (TPR) repeat protein
MDARGEVIDRWVGYGGPDGPAAWLASFAAAMADPAPVAQKRARFEANPDPATARTLGRISWGGGAYRDAVRYYRDAQRLDPERAGEQSFAIFEATAMGARGRSRLFALGDARSAADAVLQSPTVTPDQIVDLYYEMQGLATARSDRPMLAPYLEAALRATEGSSEPRLQKTHARLAVDRALIVERDKPKALALKRASLPDQWQEDPEALNGFAWWCFENQVNLEEAEALARKGAALAAADEDKADLLDTAAAICNARGDAREAVRLEKQAATLQPDREEFRTQLAKFRERSAGRG